VNLQKQWYTTKGFRAYTRGTVAFISENVKLQQRVVTEFYCNDVERRWNQEDGHLKNPLYPLSELCGKKGFTQQCPLSFQQAGLNSAASRRFMKYNFET